MRYSVLIVLCAAAFHASAQRAVVITSLPSTTPVGATIYLAGSANEWNPAAVDWTFAPFEGGHVLDVPATAPNTFQGKITRGSWATVEGNAAGGFLPNRNFNFSNADTLFISVLTWEGSAPPPTDLPPNVVVLDDAFQMPELDRTRRIRLFLPSNYDEPGNETQYPVLYMHDGQNLFSAQEAFAGEWQIDEAMLAFENGGYAGAIIVAIDNGPERIGEYTPFANPQYGGGQGAEYAAFIVNTLKPFIDEQFRTRPDREHNGIMGSSLGGLISFYAATAYQDVFSKVGVFSPSFWFSSDIYTFAANEGKQEAMRYFFLAGGQESANLQSQVQQMVDIMGEAGFTEDELRYDFVPNGQHSEWFWAQQFPTAFEWLYLSSSLNTEQARRPSLRIYPNPASERINLLSEHATYQVAYLYDYTGREVAQFSNPQGSMSIAHLPKGLYLLHLHAEHGVDVQKVVKE